MKIIENPRLDEFNAEISSDLKKQKILRKMKINRFKQGIKIISNNKFIFLKALKNLFLLTLGKFPLRSLEIAVGYECNFKCDQCSCALNFDTKRNRLEINEFKSAIDQAVNMGAFQFNLNGGEPLIYYDEIIELCKYIRDKGCYVHMATNGFLFNRDKMISLKGAGLISFEMGLDSSIEKIHDKNRGEGSFQKILENTKLAKQLDLMVAYNTVGTKEKIWNGDLINTVYLAEKMNVLLMITPPCVTGNWAGKLDVLLSNEEQWYIRWILSRFNFTRIDNYNGLKGLACPAAREKMALNPYGDIVSCPLIQIVYGNIKNDKLLDMQEEMLKDPYYLKELADGCLPSHDMDFIKNRLLKYRDQNK